MTANLRGSGNEGLLVNAAIAEQRLQNQAITGPGRRRPHDVVAWLGAVQAQEYPAARWALGLRMQGAPTDAAIERAFDGGTILRTHVMRPTWHFVTPTDIRWMLELTAPHVHRAVSSYNRRLGLDAAVLNRGTGIIERSLSGGHALTRLELRAQLARAGLELDTVRLAHLVMHAELECVVCSGPRRRKQFTYVLLADRAPRALRLPRDEALAELTRRYVRSHGPATTRDFAWWSGLRADEAKRGLDIIRARAQVVDGCTYWSLGKPSTSRARRATAHLLPIYDEYLVAYRDRDAVPHGPGLARGGGGQASAFQHALILGGRVAGTWSVERRPEGVKAHVMPVGRLSQAERAAVLKAVARYERFANQAWGSGPLPRASIRSRSHPFHR